MHRTLTALALPLLLATTAQAEEFTQKGKHEHGKVTLNVALEGGVLAAEIEAPAINVIGFEHAPRDAAQRKVVADAGAWLSSGARILGVPASAGCRLTTAKLEPPAWEEPEAAGKHDHDHEHEHEGEAGHADYRVSLRYTCSKPAGLAWVEPWALRGLRDVAELTVNIVTPTVQKSVTATRADERIALR